MSSASYQVNNKSVIDAPEFMSMRERMTTVSTNLPTDAGENEFASPIVKPIFELGEEILWSILMISYFVFSNIVESSTFR